MENQGKVIPHSPFVPFDQDVYLYYFNVKGYPFAIPLEYTGWRDEQLSWKKSCYVHGNLNPSPTYRVKGRDAIKLFTETCVNSFANFPAGQGKHSIMCNEGGLNMMDGVLIRVGEDDFITYWMWPYVEYALKKGNYNATGEHLTGQVFLFQVAGPRSLEVLETAAGDCLHDIEFMHHRLSRIDGKEVRILRVGMAGTLAYEVHGNIQDAWPIYEIIYKAGEPLGIRKLGYHTYMMNHTEDGFPQAYYHFPYPWEEDEGFSKFLDSVNYPLRFRNWNYRGSTGSDLRQRYRNPVELGWGGMIKFDHEFVGRKALEKEMANPRRKMVTLVWNKEDVIDVYASQFEPGETYPLMDAPIHHPAIGGPVMYADQVLQKDGKLVGISSGRAYSNYFREMISLSSIDVKYGNIGTEVIVVWGDPGTRQKKIRAKVSRFPYLSDNRNEVLDVSKIPCCAGKK